MEDIEKRLQTVEADLKEILTLLKSNPEYNRIGIPQQLSDIKKDVDELKMKEQVLQTKIVAYSGVATAVILVIVWIGDKLIEFLNHKS